MVRRSPGWVLVRSMLALWPRMAEHSSGVSWVGPSWDWTNGVVEVVRCGLEVSWVGFIWGLVKEEAGGRGA